MTTLIVSIGVIAMLSVFGVVIFVRDINNEYGDV